MSEDNTNRGGAIEARVSETAGRPSDELTKAVEAVGPSAEAVRKHLGK